MLPQRKMLPRQIVVASRPMLPAVVNGGGRSGEPDRGRCRASPAGFATVGHLMSRDAASGSVPVRDPKGRVALDRWGNHIALTPVDHRAQNDATTLHTIF